MRRFPLLTVAIVVLLTVPLSGCLWNSPRDYGLMQFELQGGSGAYHTELVHGGRHASLQNAWISPSGTRIAIEFGPNHIELWSADGMFLHNLSVNTTATPCTGDLSIAKFVDEMTFVGFVGSCAVLAYMNGTLVAWNPEHPYLWRGEFAISADGRTAAIVGLTEPGGPSGNLVVRDLFGTRNVTIEPDAEPFFFQDFTISPDGTLVAAVDRTTRFYRVDLDNGSYDLIGEYGVGGAVLFSSDGSRALQFPGPFPHGPRTVAFFNISGPVSNVTNISCVVQGWDVTPTCPHSTRWPYSASPAATSVAWPIAVWAFWQEEEPDGKVNGTTTRAAIVHILDSDSPGERRGFQAGPTFSVPMESTRGEPQPRPIVRAVRLLEDGSALAVTDAHGAQLQVFLTHADPDATHPIVVGDYYA
ncbi:MAG TPA: hypothetical protein VGB42_10325 [Candidatus Thermoplasmatota archaeon]